MSIFEKELENKIPVYYRFMNKSTAEELAKVEYGLFKQSFSRKHRSASYFMYEAYKPLTRFVPTKIMH
jgi:hypothetical protein